MNNKKTQKQANRDIKNSLNNTYSVESPLVKIQLFNVGITNDTEENILEYTIKNIKKSSKNFYIVTPNPEILMAAGENPELKQALNEADVALCDGIGLFVAGYFLGKPIKQRIVGTNFMEKLCERVADWPITVGFLGGGPSVAEKTAECLVARYPRIKVVFAGSEWPDEYAQGPISSIDILFVAFGAPKQELWMREHLNKIPVRVMMGVGGAFDQIINPSLRPPEVIHRLGLGWLYRLIREPWRIKRQSVLPFFAWEVVKERFGSGKRKP